MQFTKLFSSILDSTIWQESAETRLVWITMLAMADRNGEVHASIPGLAKRAGVTLQECEVALDCLSSPDKYSRTPDFEGRRIAEVDGGWTLLNHRKYRELLSKEERREYNRRKQAEYRAKKKQSKSVNDMSMTVNHSEQNAHSTEAEAEAEAKEEKSPSAPSPPKPPKGDSAAAGAAESKSDLEDLRGKVRGLRKAWESPKAFSMDEDRHLWENCAQLREASDKDIALLRDYLHAKHDKEKGLLVPYKRWMMIAKWGSILQDARHWAHVTGRKVKAKNQAPLVGNAFTDL